MSLSSQAMETPECKNCHMLLTARESKSERNSGRMFWSCANPACRNVWNGWLDDKNDFEPASKFRKADDSGAKWVTDQHRQTALALVEDRLRNLEKTIDHKLDTIITLLNEQIHARS